jgi:hypothetical protein
MTRRQAEKIANAMLNGKPVRGSTWQGTDDGT